MLQGGCHCGAVRYEMSEQVKHSSLCHCRDCRVCAGAPVVAWAAVEKEGLRIEGQPRTYRSAEVALPGLVDVQIATLDDPDALPVQLHVQVAERIGWMKAAHALPQFERYPG